MAIRSLLVLFSMFVCGACSQTPVTHSAAEDLGVLWVKHAAEYRAVSMQVYKQAELDLPGMLEDRSWSALPGQTNASDLPPAIIFDVDDTVVSGIDFQFTFEPPFTNAKHEAWNSTHEAVPIPGFARFAGAARAAGIVLFFVTNRPCEAKGDESCPQERTAIADVREAGIETDSEHMLLAFERDEWTKEKVSRREHVAKTHRVIMLFGDDLGDFIPCTRARPAGRCAEGATIASREALLAEYGDFFGAGWYILPNPMYGSWTTVQ